MPGTRNPCQEPGIHARIQESGPETWFRTQKVAWKHVFRLLSQQVTPSGNSRSASPLWKLRNSRLFPRKKWSRKCLQAFQKDFGGVPDGHFLSFPGIPEKVASGPSVFSTFLGIPENLPSGPSRSSNLTIRTRNRHPDMESTS